INIMVVIIGAGPAGLFTVLRLHQAGVQDILIVDPRIGKYVRFGHLNNDVFEEAKRLLNLKLKADQYNHIKDFERQLYEEITKIANISVTAKRFIRLHQDIEQPGIFIADDQGEEEFIPTNLVFDCTGSRRQVISAVNESSDPKPFSITTYANQPIP